VLTALGPRTATPTPVVREKQKPAGSGNVKPPSIARRAALVTSSQTILTTIGLTGALMKGASSSCEQ